MWQIGTSVSTSMKQSSKYSNCASCSAQEVRYEVMGAKPTGGEPTTESAGEPGALRP